MKTKDLICFIDGCNKKVYVKYMCRSHYHKWWKWGNPLYDYKKEIIQCNVPSCTTKQRAKGYCSYHYEKYRRFGNPTHKAQYESREGNCHVKHCNNPILARKLCVGHYGIFSKYKINPLKKNIECYLCGKKFSYWNLKELCVDHVYPYSKGGDTSKDNLMISCRKCNSLKSNKTLNELFEWCSLILSRQSIINERLSQKISLKQA